MVLLTIIELCEHYKYVNMGWGWLGLVSKIQGPKQGYLEIEMQFT
jgi:hypothetical protein